MPATARPILKRSRQGVLGSIDLSWSVSKELPYFIAVYGSEGTILVGWRSSLAIWLLVCGNGVTLTVRWREMAIQAPQRKGVARTAQRVWVIQADREIAGVVVNEVHGDHLLLDTVAVAPGAQGRGYGALLLARAEDDARELGLSEVRLVTNQAMTENQTFYPRHGYTETARRRQDGYDRVFYAKKLGAQ